MKTKIQMIALVIITMFTLSSSFGQTKNDTKKTSERRVDENIVNLNVPSVSLNHIHVEWGRKKMQCHGGGVCIIVIDDGPRCPYNKIISNTENNSDGWIEMKDGSMILYFYNNTEKFKTLMIDDNLEIISTSKKRIDTKNYTYPQENTK